MSVLSFESKSLSGALSALSQVLHQRTCGRSNQAKALVMMEGLDEENTPELFCQEGRDAAELIIVRPDDSEKGP